MSNPTDDVLSAVDVVDPFNPDESSPVSDNGIVDQIRNWLSVSDRRAFLLSHKSNKQHRFLFLFPFIIR